VYKRTLALAALGGLIVLPACTSGNAAFQPPATVANLSANQLQFQVGTANYNGTLALNTVVSFRQPNGLSALLDDTPNITLPFTNTGPAAQAGVDAGTHQISGSQQPPNGAAATPSTFGTGVGAFAYGFLSANSATNGANVTAFYPAANRSPYYGAAMVPPQTARSFYIGPPFVANFKDGTFPGGCSATTCAFIGYPSGFTTFGLTPTTGAYSLAVTLAGASTQIPTYNASTTMTSIAPLPVFPAPAYASDGAGGGTITYTSPAGTTETLIEIVDTTAGNSYSIVVHGAGPHVSTLPSNVGVITGGVAGPSIPVGNGVRVIAVGFDYPAMEAVPSTPNPAQAPVINNSGSACTFSGTNSTCPGQADITVAPTVTATE
jgi:hypothetical protein